ncbi:MAG: F390 synthetase-related protein [Caldilineaceae bacterium]
MLHHLLASYARTRWLDRRFANRADLLAWQDQQVQQFLPRILPRSPFYRRHFAGLEIANWRHWPTLDKNLMMANFDCLNTVGVKLDAAMALAMEAEQTRNFRRKLNGMTVGLSSGTSGNRGLFLATAREQAQWAGAALAKLLPAPLWQRQRVAFFLRANSPLYESVRSRLIAFQFFDLLDPLEQQIARLNRFQPTILIGPPSLLRLLAEETIAAQGEAPYLNIQPKKIISVAEVLDPLDELFLRTHFGQTIHQVYQATEGFLASTCEFGTLHLHEELVAFDREYLDSTAAPTTADTQRKFIPILTDFNRTSQPIIRYRLNDILTERAEACPCGRVTTALAQIEGRSDDLFYLPKVNRSHAQDWVIVFPDFIRRAMISSSRWIWEYRVCQLAPDHLQVAVRTEAMGQEQAEAAVTAALGQLCNQLDAEIPKIEFIEYTPHSGLKKLKRVERRWTVNQ